MSPQDRCNRVGAQQFCDPFLFPAMRRRSAAVASPCPGAAGANRGAALMRIQARRTRQGRTQSRANVFVTYAPPQLLISGVRLDPGTTLTGSNPSATVE